MANLLSAKMGGFTCIQANQVTWRIMPGESEKSSFDRLKHEIALCIENASPADAMACLYTSLGVPGFCAIVGCLPILGKVNPIGLACSVGSIGAIEPDNCRVDGAPWYPGVSLCGLNGVKSGPVIAEECRNLVGKKFPVQKRSRDGKDSYPYPDQSFRPDDPNSVNCQAYCVRAAGQSERVMPRNYCSLLPTSTPPPPPTLPLETEVIE